MRGKALGAAFLVIILAWVWVGPLGAAERLKVVVSIPPQKYIVEQVGGAQVEVTVLTGPGQDPHIFEPTPRVMSRVARAQIYFTVGIEFERAWLRKIRAANPGLKVVPTDKGIDKLSLAGRSGAGDPGEGRQDPHIWLSPRLLKVQAGHVARGLARAAPELRSEFEAGQKEFEAALDELDAELREILRPLKKRKFMVYHPSWGYFAREYGLVQVPIEKEGKQPTARSLNRLIEAARAEGVEVIFVQPQFSRRSAEVVARAVGGRVVVLDPLAENVAAGLRRTVRALAGEVR